MEVMISERSFKVAMFFHKTHFTWEIISYFDTALALIGSRNLLELHFLRTEFADM